VKFRVYYSDQLGRGEEIIDAPDLRSAAKRYYDAHPRVEHCGITVEVKGFRHYRVEQFETIDFMEGAKPPPLPSQALSEQPPSTLSSSRVPKMPLTAIAGAMLVFGFAFFSANDYHPQKTRDLYLVLIRCELTAQGQRGSL